MVHCGVNWGRDLVEIFSHGTAKNLILFKKYIHNLKITGFILDCVFTTMCDANNCIDLCDIHDLYGPWPAGGVINSSKWIGFLRSMARRLLR